MTFIVASVRNELKYECGALEELYGQRKAETTGEKAPE